MTISADGTLSCRDHVLLVLHASRSSLTRSEVQQALRGRELCNQKAVLATMRELEEDGSIDYDLDGNLKRFFIQGKRMGARVVIVPAAQAPRVAMPQASWFSALGAAA